MLKAGFGCHPSRVCIRSSSIRPGEPLLETIRAAGSRRPHRHYRAPGEAHASIRQLLRRGRSFAPASPIENQVAQYYLRKNPPPSLQKVAARIGCSVPGVTAALRRMECKLRGKDPHAEEKRNASRRNPQELRIAIRSTHAPSRTWLARRHPKLYLAGKATGVLDDVLPFPKSGTQRKLERWLREQLEGRSLRSILREMRPVDRDIVRFRVLRHSPARFAQFPQVHGLPSLYHLGQLESRLLRTLEGRSGTMLTPQLLRLREMARVIGSRQMAVLRVSLGVQELEILDRRVVRNPPDSLAAIGSGWKIKSERERPRQVEKELLKKLRYFLRTGQLPLFTHAGVPDSKYFRQLRALSTHLKSVNLWRLLVRQLDPVETDLLYRTCVHSPESLETIAERHGMKRTDIQSRQRRIAKKIRNYIRIWNRRNKTHSPSSLVAF